MKRSRLALIAASSLSAFALAVACGGGDDNKSGDDSSAGDSGQGSDTTVGGGDSAPPVDAGPDSSGPFCNVTPCVVSLGAGGVHTCALISDGTVRCWGGNQFGALGSGTLDAGTVTPSISAMPIPVPGESSVVKVAGGGNYDSDFGYTCALHANKTLDCWGFNEFGEIGTGTDAATTANPVPESTLLTNAVDVSASFFATCAALSSGDVACWGYNAFAQVSPPAAAAIYASPNILNAGGTKFVQVSVGYENACAVTNDGHLWCWGVPGTGAGGHVTDGGIQDQSPAEVSGIDSVASVAAGYVATCALKTDGSILCFGTNSIGLLGRVDAGAGIAPTPTPIDIPAGVKFTQLTAHTAGFCAIDTTSQVWCWGYNQNGGAGTGAFDAGTVFPTEIDVPTKVDGLTNVDQISSGAMAFHVCALIHGGAVKCWGSENFDELGYDRPDGAPNFVPTPTSVSF